MARLKNGENEILVVFYEKLSKKGKFNFNMKICETNFNTLKLLVSIALLLLFNPIKTHIEKLALIEQALMLKKTNCWQPNFVFEIKEFLCKYSSIWNFCYG